MKSNAYSKAGVDITLANQVKDSLPEQLVSTHRKGVLGKVGGFGGLFQLDCSRYRQPVLVSSVDGVGTKLKIAFALNQHNTIGQDLVNHCINDIAVLGAEPLFFLDYLAVGKLKPHVFKQIMNGFVTACRENHCSLIGGETAQMSGFYQKGEYDLSGTIIGVVEKNRILDGRKIRIGDHVIGLASNGLHTNGYSLARHIFFEQMKLKPGSRVKGLSQSVGKELLKVHVSYYPLISALLKKYNVRGKPLKIKGLAHITGGGFIDNIPRILPKDCDALIQRGTWEVPPVFQILQSNGKISDLEMPHVFNMGVGMVMVVSAKEGDGILRSIRSRKQQAWKIGEIAKGHGQTILN
ncbi:MAG TPA: phosphoribosylformylglycinamidine cyclo-ligase [Verrucomicrobiales bacterium]|nr:phosphoribosylformylglycinamidine cyclo-ligase [Verrucomicrobiales bacterium]HIL71523.1 phosphoribosylformylglycinamidine cyclo-ligase [Verrucomicrobiota bacterium]